MVKYDKKTLTSHIIYLIKLKFIVKFISISA